MTISRGYWIALVMAVSACSSQRYLNVQVLQAEKDFKDHIGLVLYDPVKRKTIYNHRGDRYFTPASNTKIFTFYASLQLLGDSVPALRYVQRNDSLIFWGTGDPGFLYENTKGETSVFNFLRTHPSNLFFSSDNFQAEHFGPGWAWDDYNYDFQVERTPFPIYGNRVLVKKVGETFVSPPGVFQYSLSDPTKTKERPEMIRNIGTNGVQYIPGRTTRPTEWSLPFRYSDDLLAKLLSDTLKREVKLISRSLSPDSKIYYSGSPDSLYQEMMQESDNFIAEQLLLMCAEKVSDTLRSEIAIDYVKKKYLFDLPDEPVWVDGSGLSRYNLFTPRSIVRLWEKIYALVPRDRLLRLLAVGGESGTLKNYYKGESPYIFGKTGTLSNNHALSGYLVTKRGHTLIFSWMNNNFAASTSDVRKRMEMVLKKIYETY